MSVPLSSIPSHADLIGSDVDSLASHMRHCARAHGRWSSLRGRLQQLHALAAGRIVTLACAAVVLGIGLFLAA
ncbi:hypothetical protein [Variovorax paradoxus]|uniref:hypothetical protein n=1 Tax=Variovorax TaxID=34072 RepID=UPI001ABC5790